MKAPVDQKPSIGVVLYHRSFYVGKACHPLPSSAVEYGLDVISLNVQHVYILFYACYKKHVIQTFLYIYSGQLSSKANKKGGCTVPWYNDPALACLDHSRSLAKMAHSAH